MPMSEETKRKLSEQARARYAAKREQADTEAKAAMKQAAEPTDETPQPQPMPVQPEESHDEYADLVKRFKELEDLVRAQSLQAAPQAGWPAQSPYGPQVDPRGRLIGTFEKYVVDPKNYDDPRLRLAEETKLQRFAFDHNYELGWDIGVSQYETKDGITTREPKFTLDLIRIVMDEETGEPTNGRYTVCQMVFHEDPQAALTVAREQGIDTEVLDQQAFLNEMRYIRMRDWLIEAFYPPKSTNTKKKREIVIGNKLVEYWEINSEDPSPIPFGSLNAKKKF